jgi:hypothetical protein
MPFNLYKTGIFLLMTTLLIPVNGFSQQRRALEEIGIGETST